MSAKWKTWRHVAKQTFSRWSAHGSIGDAAALAFYTVFSLAPVLVVLVSVAGLVFGEDAVRGRIVKEFETIMGPGPAGAIEKIVERAATDRARGVAGVLGAGMLLVGATVVFAQLQKSLNDVWEVRPRPGSFVRRFLRKRITSFALIVAIGFLLLVSLAVSAALRVFQEYLERELGAPTGWLNFVNAVLSFLVVAVLFGMIYKILPDAQVRWRSVAVGALAASLLFSIGRWAIGLYIGRTAASSTYGAAGSVVVILLWVYYASMILLLGAEFTRAWARWVDGHVAEPEPGAVRMPRSRVRGGR